MVSAVGAEQVMAYSDEFRERGALTYREQTLALFDSPALHSLGLVLDPRSSRRTRGRRSGYPPLLQYAVAVTARIYGSQRRALTELGADDLWEQACKRYSARSGHAVLPPRPPSAAQQDRFVGWLASDPDLLAELSDLFMKAAIQQAKRLGNFGEVGWPDYTEPSPRHAVLGDGTYLKPYSDVVRKVDAAGNEVLLNSRAKDPSRARVQAAFTDPKPDQKSAHGINHVTLSTWTTAGWVVLGCRQAFGSEVHQARELIAAVHDHLGERLHTVVWDRVLKGQDLHDPMAHRRLNVITKPVSRDQDVHASDGYTAPSLTTERAREMSDDGALPLGTCVYPRSAPHPPEVTRSWFYHYDILRDGDCEHDLWVDDGAMFAVEESRNGWLLKTAHAQVVQATPRPDKAQTTAYTFRLPCARAAHGFHEFSDDYTHRATPPTSGKKRALYHVRPVPRIDSAFGAAHGLRNITESYNAWFKNTLGDDKRAMRLDTDQQFLDHMCAGTLANALTWERHRRASR